MSVDASADDSDQKITKIAEGDEQVAAFTEHSQDIELVVTKATTAPDFDNSNEVPAIAVMSFSLEASTDLLIFQAADEEGIESSSQSSGDALHIHFLKPETDYTIWYRIGNRVVRGAGFSTTPADDTTTDTSSSGITYTWDNGLAQLATQSIRFSVRIGEPVPEFPGYLDYTPDVDIDFIRLFSISTTVRNTMWTNDNSGFEFALALQLSEFSLHEFSQEQFPDASMDIPLHVYHYTEQDNSTDRATINDYWAHDIEMSIYFIQGYPITIQRRFRFHYIP